MNKNKRISLQQVTWIKSVSEEEESMYKFDEKKNQLARSFAKKNW